METKIEKLHHARTDAPLNALCTEPALFSYGGRQGCSTLCGILAESWAQQIRTERRWKPGNRLPRSTEL
jgi:hypothetical protein